jgi:glycosyltransferase involved in cell wall biosynthesis
MRFYQQTIDKLSVLTPSLNQAPFIDECIKSVKNQSVQPIEHLVFDPGSTDNSRQIASSYPQVTLITENDDGQSDAINKGFQMASGNIIAWLNADDCFIHSNVFEMVIARFNAGDKPDIVYGKGIYIDESGNKLRDVYVNKNPGSLAWRLQQECGILQPALFIRRDVINRVGKLSKHLHYCMDYEYWIRCVKKNIRFAYIDENLACFRFYASNKTFGSRDKSYQEVCDMLREQFGYVNSRWLRLFAEYNIEKLDGVLATRHNTAVNEPQEVEKEFYRLLCAYNTNYDSYKTIQDNADQAGYSQTAKDMDDRNISINTPVHQVSIDTQTVPGCALRTIGPRRWAFELSWRNKQFEKVHLFLRNCINQRKNNVCVIVGNGPSLNDTDLSLLEGQDVIISNNAFLSTELVSYARYYTVVNYLVAEQSCQHINQLEDLDKIIPYWLSYCINDSRNTHFIEAKGVPEFSVDMFENVSWRHTVSFYNLHIAYGLGYRKVVLIGFDHNYIQSPGVQEEDIICSDEKDINHFNHEYFQGKKWQAANVEQMEKMYALAKEAFEADGRKIVNATKGGNLSLFPRQDLAVALHM